MTSAVDLSDIKRHLRIEDADTSEDVVLTSYLSAAKTYVAAFVRRDLDAEFSEGWPSPVDQAVRGIVMHWYTERTSDVPTMARDLLQAYRSFW